MKVSEYYECCTLCPRECGVNRTKGEMGVCHVSSKMRIARAALHMWEEPCISGKEGSGAVFFCGCSLRCCFCQNHEISAGDRGEEVTIEHLAEIFLGLQEQKANNINLVTAGHYIPSVAEAIRIAKEHGLQIPIVYNSSGYEKVESLRMLDGLIDIYLPDYKYEEKDLAAEYSRAKNYTTVARKALDEMIRQVPQIEFDDRGMMQRGVIVRHLLMPGSVKNSKAAVDYLYKTYGNRIYISMMNQYTPMIQMENHEKLGRKVTKREYERLLEHALSLGVEQAFIQEGDTVGESFIPVFDGEGVS